MAASKRSPKASDPPASAAGPSETSAAPRTVPGLDLKTLGTRVGLPLAIGWVVAALSHSKIVVGVMAVLTIAAGGLIWYARNFTKKAQRVQSIVAGARTKEERQAAIAQLDQEFKKDDAAGVFAKAQLQMQEDPETALRTLEQIDLQKVTPQVADEARAQRGMLHLMLGEAQKARQLVDAIDLQRHPDQKSKATLAAVQCEAWARTGQAKRAQEILELFDANDAALADVKAGLLRSQVFAYGAMDDIKKARTAMHALAKMDPRIVAGFAQKGVHPLLVQEAKKILERSGNLPRMTVRNPSR
jgi:hypothetical protein